MGIQAVKGVEIGDGFVLARLRGSQAHDEIVRGDRGLRRETNRAGGIEGGMSNGEEIVVRAAMKPLPTLMKPLASVDLQTGEPAEALVERSDVSAVEALAVVAEAAVAWELARAACEKFGGDALGDFVAAWRAYVERIDWHPQPAGVTRKSPSRSSASWAPGKTTLAAEVALRIGRPLPRSRRRDRTALGLDRRGAFPQGEADFRERRRRRSSARCSSGSSRTCSRSAAARSSPSARADTARARHHCLDPVDVGTAWQRVEGSGRPLAQAKRAFEELYRRAAAALRRSCRCNGAGCGRCRPRRGRRPRRAWRSATARRARPRRRPSRPRQRSARRRHPRHGRAARSRHAAGADARAATRRRSQDPRSDRSPVARPSPRPERDDRRARRRLYDRRGRLRRGDLSARHRLGAGADEPRRAGRRGDRRQDRDRPTAGQEPRRCVPLARTHRHRPGTARDAAARAAARGHGRGREDGAPRRRAVPRAAATTSSSGAAPRSRQPSACAIRTTAPTARC